jgi:hypothetical protein
MYEDKNPIEIFLAMLIAFILTLLIIKYII